MKRMMTFVLAGALLLSAALAFAGDETKATKTKGGATHYLVMWTHTPEECLAALDDIVASGGEKAIGTWDFGCEAGDHTAYRMITAKSDEAAMAMLPATAKDKAKLIKLNKFTAAQVKTFHEKMANEQPK